MKKNLSLIIFVTAIIFLSGCKTDVKISGDKVNACFFRSCKNEQVVINGWTTFFNDNNEIVNFESEEDCVKEVYKIFGVNQKTYTSLPARVYGIDYKYVKGLTNEEKDVVINASRDSKNNPYSNYQKIIYDSLAEKYPKLSFLTKPCTCNEFCLAPTIFSSNFNFKVSLSNLQDLECGSKSDVDDLSYFIVHNDCCWVTRFNCGLNPYSEQCSWFKCGEVKRLSDIPACGCLCGTEILAIDGKKCCINGKPQSC